MGQSIKSGGGEVNVSSTGEIFLKPRSDKGSLAQGSFNTALDSGSTDAYAVTLNPPLTALQTRQLVWFKANTANTGPCTLNVNGFGAKAIKKVAGGITTDLATNDIRAGQYVCVIYDGTNFQMLSASGNAPAAPTPGGVDTQVQFNDDGAFGGSAHFTFDGTKSGIGAPIDSPPAWPINTFDNGMTVGYTKTSAFTTDYVEGLSNGLILDLPANAPGGYVHALESVGLIKSGNNKNLHRLFGAFLAAQHSGTGTVSQFVGVYGLASNLSTGTCTYAVGGEFSVSNPFGGTIPDAYGVYIDPANNGGGGVITNNYGIYIDAQSAGVNNWNVFSVGATKKNVFEGPIISKAAAPPTLENGQFTFTLDEAGNRILWTVKYAAGTSKTGEIALT